MKTPVIAGIVAVAGFLFFSLQPVSAESSPPGFGLQPQVSTLVSIAIPPYKW